MTLQIRPAALEGIREIRHLVLRPHQRPEDLVYDGDAAPDSLHLGAFEDGRLVAIASVSRQPPPGSDDPAAWRLRGMATLPEARGRGIGARLLEGCVAHVRSQGGSLVWCNGRIGATPFYVRHGFEIERGPFDLPGLGPHHELRRVLT
ncbi:MAG: GNAT family N-acetyltransferase [Actinomycetota bacterium]